jgi:hypothetical protein
MHRYVGIFLVVFSTHTLNCQFQYREPQREYVPMVLADFIYPPVYICWERKHSGQGGLQRYHGTVAESGLDRYTSLCI